MKGQFFLIGAVLVCMLLYAGTAPLSAVYGEPSDDMTALSENMAAEMPHALNIGVNASDPAGVLLSFSNFSRSAAASRGIDMEAVFVVFESSSSGIMATAGNAAAGAATVGVSVSGTYEELYVAAGALNSTAFPPGTDTFDASVTAGGVTYDATIPANKTGMYAMLSLSRGGMTITKELLT